MTDYIVGVDLGQSNDYTAIIVLRRPGEDGVYWVDRQERTRGISYVEIVDRVKAIISKLPGAILVVDQTGVGAPVVDMFQKANLYPVGVLIHGGARVTYENGTCHVPKRDLVYVVQVLLQNRQLKVAMGPLREILVRELLNFKIKIDAETAHDSYSAWREGDHDDLVLSVALAAWWAEQHPFYEWVTPTQVFGSHGYEGPYQ